MAKSKSETKATKVPRAKSTVVTKEFALEMPGASAVFVAGDFNQWGEREVKLKMDKKGVWKAKVKLELGTYQYKFLVDGDWILDPANPSSMDNPFGGRNSILVVE